MLKASAEQRLAAHTHSERSWDLEDIGWHAPSGLRLVRASVPVPGRATLC